MEGGGRSVFRRGGGKAEAAGRPGALAADGAALDAKLAPLVQAWAAPRVWWAPRALYRTSNRS